MGVRVGVRVGVGVEVGVGGGGGGGVRARGTCCLLSSRSRSAFRVVPASEQPLLFPNGRQASDDLHQVRARDRVST